MADIEWRVYYDDGSTFDSTEGGPQDAPTRGVIAIVEPNEEVGRIVLSGHDYYIYREEWYGTFEQFGLWDYLAAPGWKKVLFGRTVPNETFRRIYNEAVKDPDFPTKSAWHKDENRLVDVDL